MSLVVNAGFYVDAAHAEILGNSNETAIDRILGAGRGISIAPLVYTQIDIGNNRVVYKIAQERRSAEVLARVTTSGLSFVRVPVNPDPLAQGTLERKFAVLQIIDVVKQVHAAGLGVVVDIHPWSSTIAGMCANLVDPVRRQYLLEAEGDLAQLLQLIPGVALELFNEPPNCTPSNGYTWQSYLNALYINVRNNAPTLPLVVTGLNGYIDQLLALDISAMIADPNIIYTFHYYEPFIFTHQQTYSGGVVLHAIPYPPRLLYPDDLLEVSSHLSVKDALVRPKLVAEVHNYLRSTQNDAMITKRIHSVLDWAVANGISANRIWLGEFGTTLTEGPDGEAIFQDHLHWLSTVRQQAENCGFAWTYWLYPNSHLLDYNPETEYLKLPTLAALGLH